MSRGLSIAALILVGCGHPAPATHRPVGTSHVAATVDAAPPPPPVPLDQDYPRLAERSGKLYADLAAAFAATGEDCTAATAKLGELRTAYADVVAANAKVLHDGRAKELKAALEPHEDAMSATAKAIVESPTLAACAQDRTFTDAFDALVAPP